MTGINSYSTTASENVQANTGVNWDEGMAPGAVNNSARQNMADLRAAFDDLIWFQYGIGSKSVTHVYASATSTTITGADVTAVYHAGRRVRAVGNSTGTIYGTISSSSYNSGTSTTTVNYGWDSGSLVNETLAVSLSQIPITGFPGPATKLPTRQVLTTGTSATYTTPPGARQLRIRMIGGGGGGGGSGNSGSTLGGSGGNTVFNSIIAAGGGGGKTTGEGGLGGTGGSGSASFRAAGGSGQNGFVAGSSGGIIGTSGGSSLLGGATANVSSVANTGAGGGGGGTFTSGVQTGAGGGSGEYVELILNAPSTSYTYTIGAGGSAGSPGGAGLAGLAGASGVIVVDELY